MNYSLIHHANPYDNFNFQDYPLDLQGWGSQDPNFRKLIDELQPKLILEVGTWKGGSAIFMGEYVREKNLDCKIVCIDTWLGAVEFLTDKNDPERYISLGLRNGYPSVYYQFLANVMHQGLQDIIIPFPQTSVLAARFLMLNNIQADMIYIDASHDEKDVYDDINNYWNILKEGGVIFGDDYDEFWPGVKLAVNNFVIDNNLEILFTDRQWIIRKPKDVLPNLSENIYQRSRDNKKLALEYERDLFLYRAKYYDLEFRYTQICTDASKLNHELFSLQEQRERDARARDVLERELLTLQEQHEQEAQAREALEQELLTLQEQRERDAQAREVLEQELKEIKLSRGWKIISYYRNFCNSFYKKSK